MAVGIVDSKVLWISPLPGNAVNDFSAVKLGYP